jgi:hypothetical protein
MVNILRGYFGERLHYCERYDTPEKTIEKCAETNLQKDHDFDGATPVVAGIQHLVTCRNPLRCLESWYEADTLNGRLIDSPEHYRDFCGRMARYWAAFMAKWVFTELSNRLVIEYDRLIAEPVLVMGKVISFMAPNERIETDKVLDCINQVGIIASRRPALRYCEYA